MTTFAFWRFVAVPGTLLALAGGAEAISPARLRALPLIVEDKAQPGGMVRLESVGRYLAALRKAGHRCTMSTYAYGGDVSCHTRGGGHVLIHLDGIPTRGPEFAGVGSVRPEGINSTPVPTSEVPAFLAGLKRR